jgi:hypothetical protein
VTGGGLNLLTTALNWARETKTVRDSSGFGRAAYDYLQNTTDSVRNLASAPGAPVKWDGGKLRMKRADESAWQPVDEIVDENLAAVQGGWEAVKGVPVIGDAAGLVAGGVANAFAEYDENVIQPVFNYAKATDRHYINLMTKHDQTGDFGYAAEGLGTLFGLGGLIGGDEFDLEFENAARYSIGQQVVAEATGKFSWDAETGRMVAPLLDDPNQEQQRQEYFSRGWQRFFSGTLDIAANIGLDPATYVTLGAGTVIRGASTATADVVQTAGRTSRGAEAASLADEARWIETTDADLLGQRTVKDLKDLLKEDGLPTSGKKADLVDRLTARERKIPEGAQFDPKAGTYVPEGSSFVQKSQGLRERIGLDPERNFKANYEKITDWVIENGEKAGSIADLKNNPLMRQLDDSGPVLDALHSAKKYGDQQSLGDLEMRGLLDDVLLSSMGSTQATARVQKFSRKLYADMIDIEHALGEGRKSVMASPYIPFKDKLDAFETDPAVKVQIEAIADDMRVAATKLDRLQNQVVGKGVRAHNAVGRGVYAAPGAIRKGIDAGMTGVYKTFRPNGTAGPRVHLMNGVRLPNTLNFASLNVVEEFNQHVDEALVTLKKERLETPDGRLDIDDEALDVLTRFKDEFAKTEDPIGRRNADALAARRRALFEDFQVATRDAMVHKLTAKVVARQQKAGNAINSEQIRSEVDTWMLEYEKQSKATVEGFHRKRNDTDPAHISNEYIALSDNDFVVPHQGLAAALDKATPTTSHRFRFDAFEEFFSKKFELGKVFNDVTPEGVSVRTIAGEIGDEINDHLKWLLLGRPVAYSVRNAFESSQRILATQDVLTAFATMGRGLLNGGANMRRVSPDQVRLAEAQLNHSIMERRLMEERADLEQIHTIHQSTAESLKRKHKSSGSEFNRAAEIQARMDLVDEQIERSRQITNMTPDEWRARIKERAGLGLEKQISDFEQDLATRQASLERIDGLKEPTASDLHLRDEIGEDIEMRTQALAEARKAKEAASAARAAESRKRVPRGKTVLRKGAGFEGGLDPHTGLFVPPSLLNAYDNPLAMQQHVTDSFESVNRMIETSTAKWGNREFRIRNREISYSTDTKVAQEWNENYAALVNNRIRKDAGAMQYALTQREDDLLRWATDEVEGQAWAKQFTGSTGMTLEGLVDETVALVDELLPTGRHLSIAARRDLAPDEVDEMWTQAKAMTPQEAQAKFKEAQGVTQKQIGDLDQRIEVLEGRIAEMRSPALTPRGQQAATGQGELPIGVRSRRTKPLSATQRKLLDRMTKQRNELITERQSRLGEDSTRELARETHVAEAQRIARPTLSVPERAFQDIVETGQRPRGFDAAYAGVKDARDRYFHAFSAVPEGVWSRHPLFVMKFQSELNNVLQAKGVKPTGRRGKATEADASDYLSLEDINRSVEAARKRARRYVTDTLYDTSRRTNLQHHLRYLSPFFAAWQDSFVKWTKISLDQPLVPYLGYQGYEELPNVFAGAHVVDEDGNYIGDDGQVHEYNPVTREIGAPIEGKVVNPNTGTILWRVPGPVGDWMEDVAGVTNLRIPRTTFNVAFQGENPAIPGFGGFVSVPYGEIVRKSPWAANMAERTGLDKIIAPYGPGGRVGEEGVPSWLQKAFDFFNQNDEPGKRAFAMLYQAQLNAEALGQTEPLSRDARDKLVDGRVGMWQFFNMTGAQSPFSVSMDSTMRAASDLFYDSYSSRIGDGEGEYPTYTAAVAAFNADFPEFANAGISVRADDSGINASYGAQNAAEKWRTAIGKDPALARVLIGPTTADSGDYNDAIAQYQRTDQVIPGGSSWRAGLTDKNISEVILVENGKREWSRFNMLLSEVAEERGLEWEDPQLSSLRKRFRDDYMATNHGEWYAEYTSDSYNKNEVVKTLAGAYEAILSSPEHLETTPHLATLKEYIEGREQVKLAMEQQGFATATSQEFEASELGYAWSTFVGGLLERDIEFQRLYYEGGFDRDDLQYVLPDVG